MQETKIPTPELKPVFGKKWCPDDDGDAEAAVLADSVRKVGSVDGGAAPSDLLQAVGVSSPAKAAASHPAADLVVGQRVEARPGGFGRWQTGVVSRVRSDGTLDVMLDNNTLEASLPKAAVKALAVAASAEPTPGVKHADSPQKSAGAGANPKTAVYPVVYMGMPRLPSDFP